MIRGSVKGCAIALEAIPAVAPTRITHTGAARRSPPPTLSLQTSSLCKSPPHRSQQTAAPAHLCGFPVVPSTLLWVLACCQEPCLLPPHLQAVLHTLVQPALSPSHVSAAVNESTKTTASSSPIRLPPCPHSLMCGVWGLHGPPHTHLLTVIHGSLKGSQNCLHPKH